MIRRLKSPRGIAAVAAVAALILIAIRLVPAEFAKQRVVRNYARLLAASFAGDLETVRSLCSTRYLRERPPEPAPQGGVKGMPRGINKNFQVWRDGPVVLLCPTNRIGPVYEFVWEDGWKFNGSIGLLRSGGRLERMATMDEP